LNKIRIACVGAVALVAAFPHIVLPMIASVAIFGGLAFAGAWIMDRYGDLPGGDRRCA
jgi:hypothetical protein